MNRRENQRAPGTAGPATRGARRQPAPVAGPAELDARPAPPVVDEVLGSTGQPLAAPVRAAMQPWFGHSFGQVRVHTGERAAEAADRVGALAFTSGSDVVFGASQYQPHRLAGQRMIAHELAHVVQQRGSPSAGVPVVSGRGDREAHRAGEAFGRSTPVPEITPVSAAGRVIQRTPAPPEHSGTVGVLDRSKITVTAASEVIGSATGNTVTLTPATIAATVATTEPSVNHISWELYDPSDTLIDGISSTPGKAGAAALPWSIDGSHFHGTVRQGRYTLRCIGRNNGKPVVFTDHTFFVWTRKPLTMQSLPELQAVTAAPATHTLSEVGAATARSMMLKHQAAVSATGTGKYMGNKVTDAAPAGVSKEDCTTYVLSVLEQAFTAKGQKAKWDEVFKEARRVSGPDLKGTALMAALESKAGWKGVFWAPDPRNPADSDSEHPVAHSKATTSGTYYGVDVAKTLPVVDYRPTLPTKAASMTRLDQLRRVPLAVIAARGGKHMTLLLNGHVYEVHWDLPATDPNVIGEVPLERWAWLSGAAVMPPESFTAAFGP
jgi:hypothetical protein